MADHFDHADASMVWLVRRPGEVGRDASADAWEFEYVNPSAMRALGVSTLPALRAIRLPVLAPSPELAQPFVSRALTPKDFLMAARIVAERVTSGVHPVRSAHRRYIWCLTPDGTPELTEVSWQRMSGTTSSCWGAGRRGPTSRGTPATTA